MGRTLRAGIRVREKLGDTPIGPLYSAEYPTGLEVGVLFLGNASTDPATLALLRQRFRHAIQILHPNVAAIYEVSETHDGLVYVVAECLAGELLSETLSGRGALPLGEALDFILQAAAGLQAAHIVGWTHGNLSPETMLVTHEAGGRPLIKLIGFTQELLPRRIGSERPVQQDMSPAYASPERIAGRPPDERSDVFSLGAVLYHLLTGVPPTLDSGGARVPETLRAALDRALAPSPARRFQTVAEFVAAITPGEEATAAVIPKPRRAAGRGALALGAAAAALVAIGAGLWLLWGAHQPSVVALARPSVQESGSVAVVGPNSTSRRPRPAADSGLARRVRRDSAATRVRRDSAAARLPTDSSARAPHGSPKPDSVPGPRISPFQRSHPWVAVSGERFYYRSGCPIPLESRDLLYFTSEQEARASGFVPTQVPECR